jgi:hypothetical protein
LPEEKNSNVVKLMRGINDVLDVLEREPPFNQSQGRTQIQHSYPKYLPKYNLLHLQVLNMEIHFIIDER